MVCRCLSGCLDLDLIVLPWAAQQAQAGSSEKRSAHAWSVFLRHRPENLHAAIVTVGKGDVVVLGNFPEQGFPVVRAFLFQAEDQRGAAALGGGAVDYLLDANTQLNVAAWGGGGGAGHRNILVVLYVRTVFQRKQFRNSLSGKIRRGWPEGSHCRCGSGVMAVIFGSCACIDFFLVFLPLQAWSC